MLASMLCDSGKVPDVRHKSGHACGWPYCRSEKCERERDHDPVSVFEQTRVVVHPRDEVDGPLVSKTDLHCELDSG